MKEVHGGPTESKINFQPIAFLVQVVLPVFPTFRTMIDSALLSTFRDQLNYCHSPDGLPELPELHLLCMRAASPLLLLLPLPAYLPSLPLPPPPTMGDSCGNLDPEEQAEKTEGKRSSVDFLPAVAAVSPSCLGDH